MILVTGATGKVGQEVVKELQKRKAPFKVGARSPEKVAGMDAVPFDFDRPETFGAALAGVDSLFLLTPPGGTEREVAVVDAAKKARVKHLVKLSVWGADGEAFVFGRGHRAVERTIEASGLPWTFLRPNGFMQNFSTAHVAEIRNQGAFVLCGADGAYGIIDARDIGAVAAKVLTEPGHEGKAYTLSGPEALSNLQMAEKLSKAIGKPVKYVDMPEAEYKEMLVGFGMPEPFVDAFIDLQHYYHKGGGEPVTGDVEQLLGRKPGSFDKFAKDHAAVWK
ncbi:MAG: SDR family oxidoreductase [Thermoanaerobaculia bacterium]